MKNIEKYRYLHILGFDELKFSIPLVKLINENTDFFNPQEHVFVTAHKNVYENLNHYSNVYFYKVNPKYLRRNFSVPIINEYGKKAKYIIVHDGWSAQTLIKIKLKFCKKVIWRTWGGVLFLPYSTGKDMISKLKNMVKLCINKKAAIVCRSFYAIGVANLVDEIDIKNLVGNVKTYPMSYCDKDMYEIVEKESKRKLEKSECVNILIGHSGYDQDNHIENIERLNVFSNEDIKVYFLFAYGDEDYMRLVKLKAIEVFGEKAVFIEEFIPFEEYVAFLNKMDIAILDATHSTALGNLAILMQLKKKIYVNRNGIYAQAMKKEGLSCYYSDDISKISFKEFVSNYCDIAKYENSDLLYKDRETDLKNWKKIFDGLN